MAWQEEILKAGGVAAAAIGLVGVTVTGAVTCLNDERITDNQRAEIARKEDREAQRDLARRSDAICAATYALMQDETPNPMIRTDRAVASQIVRNLEIVI